jgi:hypothetical protein
MMKLRIYGTFVFISLIIGCVYESPISPSSQKQCDIPVHTAFGANRRLTEDDVVNILKQITLKSDERIMIISEYSPTKVFVYTAEKGVNKNGRKITFIKKKNQWHKSATNTWNSDD